MDLLHAHSMTRLKTRFLVFSEMPPEVLEEVEALDRLAFANQNDDSSIHWAEPEWMALGFLEDRLVSQICLHKREILVGEEPVWVAGVGGVATHPTFLRRGFASQVLRDCAPWMRDELAVPFGLLLCAEELKPFYARCGWQKVASSLSFLQDDQCRQLDACVMIQILAGVQWHTGKIDLRGLPW